MRKNILLLAMGLILFSCGPQENPNPILPSVSTGAITNITSNAAVCAGNVTATGGASVTARGICWSTSQFPTIADSKTSSGNGLGVFTGNITGLSPNITYYVRAYASNSVGTAYGEQTYFTTNQEIPTVVIGEIVNITSTSATCTGDVTANGGAAIIARGVCWSTSQNPTILNSKTTNGNSLGVFTGSITGLTQYTTYYVRAYATNVKGTAYGEQKFFTTKGCPIVVTGSIDNITSSEATCTGYVTNDGGSAIIAQGICWSTSQTPTTANFKTMNGTEAEPFTGNLTGLSQNTTYYVRAYATNAEGTGYGEQKSFITNGKPTVVTGFVTNITTSSASCSGNVISEGGLPVTERGVCWSISQDPTISNSKTLNGNGLGTFNAIITDLSPNTIYYIRTYATNTEGTAYGEQKSFRTFGSFTDSRDGHVYKYITIGSQVWMAENLAYLTTVNRVNDESENFARFYVYGYDDTSVDDAKATENYKTYGVLYNWPAAMNGSGSSDANPSGVQGICPAGWHLPSNAEWTELTTYLGNNGYNYDGSFGVNTLIQGVGKIAKSMTIDTGWRSYTEEVGAVGNPDYPEYRNKSGFSAIPSGQRLSEFNSIGLTSVWWSSTAIYGNSAWYRDLYYTSSGVVAASSNKKLGFSVRCVKDSTPE